MSHLYRKTAVSERAAMVAAASETLEAELLRYSVALRDVGRTDEATLAVYWAGVVASADPAAEVSSAVYAALRIGAAMERTNAERAFTEPVRRSRKAIGDRAKATAASVPAKQAAADKKLKKEYTQFCREERKKNPKAETNYLRQKFLKTLGRRRQERLRRLINR